MNLSVSIPMELTPNFLEILMSYQTPRQTSETKSLFPQAFLEYLQDPFKQKETKDFTINELEEPYIKKIKSISEEEIKEGNYTAARPLSGFQAIAATLAVLRESRGAYWNTEEWVRSMGNRCYQQQYEGDWAILQVILQTSTIYQVADLIAQILLGPRAYHGNLKPAIERYSLTVRLRSSRKQGGRIRRRSRRRGYNDKGHIVWPWEDHGIPGKPSEGKPDPLDFRSELVHPLLSEEKAKTQVGKLPVGRVSEVLQHLQEKVQQRKELIQNALRRRELPAEDDIESNFQDTGKVQDSGSNDHRGQDVFSGSAEADQRTTSEPATETGSKETSPQATVRQEDKARE